MANRVYLDSNVVLAYLKQDSGRADIIEAAMTIASADKPEFIFYTSALSLAEVAYIEGLGDDLAESFDAIDLFWASAPILIVEVNEINARRAREILRHRANSNPHPQVPQAKRRSADALHLATAVSLKLDEFWTYDLEDFRKYSVEPLRICNPYRDPRPLFRNLELNDSGQE